MTQSPAIWGASFAAIIYLLGNGIWVNRWARSRPWIGWLTWLISCPVVLIAGAAIENHFGTGSSIIDRLTSVDPQNHWIAIFLYALLSVPGAACVILKQDIRWTRVALMSIALVIFIPAGLNLGKGEGSISLALGLAGAVCGLLWLWQATLDDDPIQQPATT
ncbi:MAG: hypothetical protein Q9M26_00845 [Mariprofundales bacterium]|nr:hypothetical protein [Mariprofundales bacterium]